MIIKRELPPNFECLRCKATFVREDSYKSHLRVHQRREQQQQQQQLVTQSPTVPTPSGMAASVSAAALVSSDDSTSQGSSPSLSLEFKGKSDVVLGSAAEATEQSTQFFLAATTSGTTSFITGHPQLLTISDSGDTMTLNPSSIQYVAMPPNTN